MDPAQTDLLNRTCVAYPWARECQGLAPIVPSAAQNASLWSGPGGYQELVGVMKKDIPLGTQCEAVQLVPTDAIGNRPPDPPLGQSSNSVYLQFPTPAIRGIGMDAAATGVLGENYIHRLELINQFI